MGTECGMQDSVEQKVKSPWFRFHLSTAVIVMLAAGEVLGVNMKLPRDSEYCWACGGPHERSYGWPVGCVFETIEPTAAPPYRVQHVAWAYVAANVGCNLAALFALGTACEWLTRRRRRQVTGV